MEAAPLELRGALVAHGVAAPRPLTVVIEGDRIAALRAADAPVGEGTRVVELTGHLITPGLIDAHTHLFLAADFAKPGAYERELMRDSIPLRTLRGAAHGRLMLDQGFTTVRDVCTEGAGYADVALAEAVRTGICEGPRVVPSGPGIGITGGYLPTFADHHVCAPKGCVVRDGADALRQEVREQVSHGVAWIKVFADWPGADVITGKPDVRPTFTPVELEAVCDEAARRGRRVAAHVTSDAGARQAVECGAASIEHLGPLSRETLDRAAERGVFLVPTLSVLEHFVDADPDPRWRDDARRRLDVAREALGRALAAGVRIVLGSDIGAYPHAKGSRSELRLLMEAGMTPLAALGAATREAAALLGMSELGVIAPSAAADVCVFRMVGDGDVRRTLTGDPPTMVISGGRIVRGG